MNDDVQCFISYASDDVALAQALHDRLTAEKIKVWFDRARLNPGCDWHKEIEQGCEVARVILPVLTPRWKLSEWTRFETYGHMDVVPLLFSGEWEEVKTGPLSRWQFHDMRIPTDASWNALTAAIRQLLAKPILEKAKRVFNLRYPPNPHFVGRDEKLIGICEELHAGRTAALTQGKIRAITALGGVGKTTLASEYVHRFWRLYTQIFWVDARHGYETEFARIHDILYPDRPRLTEPEKAKSALIELSGQIERLLVIDNAADEKTVQDWIPKSGSCHVLITSRFSGWSKAVKSIPVYVLEPEPAQALLQSRSNHKAEGAELTACSILAEKLGYLPLALEIAAAYIEQQGEKFGFSDYVRLFDATTKELLEEKRFGSTEYPDSVVATWKPTIEKLTPDARAILRVCAYMAGTPVPFELFGRNAAEVHEFALRFGGSAAIATPLAGELRMRQASADLKSYSMAQFDGADLQFHPLVQTIEKLNGSGPTEAIGQTNAFLLLSKTYPDSKEPTNWPLCSRLTPHVEAFLDCSAIAAEEPCAQTFARAGYYLRENTYLPRTVPLLRKALALNEARLGLDHPSVAADLHDLALALDDGKHTDEAEAMFRRALAIDEAQFGSVHSTVARDLNSLALCLDDHGPPEEVETLYRRAIRICEKGSEAEKIELARCLNNFGLFLEDHKRYEDAETQFRRALEITETAGSQDERRIAVCLSNLASVLSEVGRKEEAELLIRRALTIEEACLGRDNPHVAIRLNNLALLLMEKRQFEQAEDLLQRAVRVVEEREGADHQRVAMCLRNLATLFAATGRADQSESSLRRALGISEAWYGADEDQACATRYDLAQMLLAKNERTEAERLLRQTVEIRETKYGADSGDITGDLNALAEFLFREGRLSEAETLYRRMLEIDQKNRGSNHPDVARDLNNLSSVLGRTGHLEEAELLLLRALKISESTIGTQNTTYASRLYNLAVHLVQTNRHAEAEPLLNRVLGIREAYLGAWHPDTTIVRENLNWLHDEIGNRESPSLRVELLARIHAWWSRMRH